MRIGIQLVEIIVKGFLERSRAANANTKTEESGKTTGNHNKH